VRGHRQNPELFLFEPTPPELCNFTQTTFVISRGDRAKACGDGEIRREVPHRYYAERAYHRGNHARRSSGPAPQQAEAFQRVTPAGGAAL